jgi:hypothetical protein
MSYDPPCEPVHDRRIHWVVKLAKHSRHRKVLADYYRVDTGVLTFRNTNSCGYPHVVAVFAPGHWLEITNDDI